MADSRNDERTYRRGLVMGLTMAEIMILLLFVLLLLFGLRMRKELPSSSVAQVPNGNQILVDLAKAAGIPAERIPNDFTTLVLVMQAAQKTAGGLGTPSDVLTVLNDATLGQKVREGLGPNRVGAKPGDTASDFIADATKRYGSEYSRARGPGSSPIWFGAMETKQPGGPGGDFPPCARTSDGKPALVLTAELFDDHVMISDRDLESVRRTAPAAERLFDQLQRGAALGDSAFLQQTQAVFSWSVAQKCRFFVYVADRTGAGAKLAYKRRLSAVEGRFYKLLGGDGG